MTIRLLPLSSGLLTFDISLVPVFLFASAGRSLLPTFVLRRGAFAPTSCILFSTGCALIVRAEFDLVPNFGP